MTIAQSLSTNRDWMTGFTMPGEITTTSLTLPTTISYKDWERGIEFLGMLEGASRFWLGDAIEQGEAHFGEKYAQALHLTKLSLGRLKNITYTCRNVEKSRRRDDLSFEHHTVVAPLEPEEQIEWLTRAAEDGWDPEELRDEIRKERGFSPLSSYTEELERANGRMKGDLRDAHARLAAIEAEAGAQCKDDPADVADRAYWRDTDEDLPAQLVADLWHAAALVEAYEPELAERLRQYAREAEAIWEL